MSWLHAITYRVRTLLNSRAFERDLDEEMRHHLELDAMQQHDRDRAKRRFGNRTYYIEETRRMSWIGLLDTIQQDTRFAWRSLKRNPGLTVLIVITLTLGIGVNAATFSLLDKIYLRYPTGVADPEDLHRIWFLREMSDGSGAHPAMSYPMYRALRQTWSDTNRIVLVNRTSNLRLGGTFQGAKLDALYAEWRYFDLLGVRPQLGRFFTPDEDRLGSPVPVAVLSDHVWRHHFGADPTIVGKHVRLGEHQVVVVGVGQRGFTGVDLEPVDVWLPLASYPTPSWMKGPIWESPHMFIFHAFTRAAPGMPLHSFEQRATRAVRDVVRKAGLGDTLMVATTGSIIYARGPGREEQEHVLSTRLSAVALIVLLVAAANVVNMLLVRATRRRRETAVRLALGVGRWRLVRMLTAETLLLALVAATAAVVAAWWGTSALRSLLLPDVRFADAALGLRVVVFTFGVAIAAGLVAGMIPALQSSNHDLTRALKEGGREGGVQRSFLRDSLVVTQTALSIVLLAGASLFVRSLQNVRGLDIGFDPRSTVIATVNFDPGQEPARVEHAARIVDVGRRLEQRPGVEAVSIGTMPPMAGFSFWTFWFDNDSSHRLKERLPVVSIVDENYFAATGVRLLGGRVFTNLKGAPAELVINEPMAKLLWPGEDPLGKCLRFNRTAAPCYSVVGIVETSRRDRIVEEPVAQYYLPIKNLPAGHEEWTHGTVLLARTAPDAGARVLADVADELKAAFPKGYPNTRFLSTTLEDQFRPWRVGALLFSGFGVLALVVALVGIYSTVSWGVSQRTHEFGVRVALGARLADVLRLVLGDGLRPVAIGAAVGVVLALAGGRLIAALLYGIEPHNVGVIAGVSLTLLSVAALATLGPALRAAHVDPVEALRSE